MSCQLPDFCHMLRHRLTHCLIRTVKLETLSNYQSLWLVIFLSIRPRSHPRFSTNWENAWDHCYVTGWKWWTRIVQTESTISGLWHSNNPSPSPDFCLQLWGRIWKWPGDEATARWVLGGKGVSGYSWDCRCYFEQSNGCRYWTWHHWASLPSCPFFYLLLSLPLPLPLHPLCSLPLDMMASSSWPPTVPMTWMRPCTAGSW